MARIKILELPSDVVGEFVRTPFAIVIDQAPTTLELTQEAADQIAERIGAAGAILVGGTLEVV